MQRCKLLTILFIVVNFTVTHGQSAKIDSINAMLDSVYQTDQNIRFELMDFQKEGDMQSDAFNDLVSKVQKTDSVNVQKIKALLNNNGWPENLNEQGNQTIFLVIQHADLDIQQEYLPLVRKAVKEGKVLLSGLALLEDRVASREGRKQTYGSQVYIDPKTGKKYVLPLKDPETVDQRRVAVGLPPMSEYSKLMQMEWSLERYYQDLPEIEALLKNMTNN